MVANSPKFAVDVVQIKGLYVDQLNNFHGATIDEAFIHSFIHQASFKKL